MIDLKNEVASLISSSVEALDLDTVYGLLEYPPDEKLGDVSLPCFKLSKTMRKAPPAIAAELSAAIDVTNSVFERVEVVGGYLNFFISHAEFAKSVIGDAQSGKINPDLLKGATFTVSNLGSLGIESFTPIVNPPQTAILGVDCISKRIKEVNGEDVTYPAMGLSLTVDHRAIDGADAARFLKDIGNALENIDLLLMK